MRETHNPDVHIFFPNTRFERLARRPGGVPREKALARAEKMVDELKSDFGEWLDRELQELTTALSKAERDLNDNAALEDAYRNCAQLQGVCAAMGYDLVTFVAENLCKIISTVMTGAAYDKEMIDCHTDAFLLAKTEQYRAMRPDQVPEMASGLRRVVELAAKTSASTKK
jgi:chemotaxis protein histidine kinase CheA